MSGYRRDEGRERWGGAEETTGYDYGNEAERRDRFGRPDPRDRGYGPGGSYGGGGRGEAYAGYSGRGDGDRGDTRQRGGFGSEQYRGEEQGRGNWGGYHGEQSALYRGPYGSGGSARGPGQGGGPEERRGWGEHRGRGPRGYTRSDERIREDVNDRLADDPHLDARDIEIAVQNGEVTINGHVQSRADKRHAEDLAHDVSGVTHVQNNLRVKSGIMGWLTEGSAEEPAQGERERSASGVIESAGGATATTGRAPGTRSG